MQFYFIEKNTKNLLWDLYELVLISSLHGSVYHNNGLWQLEINRRLIFWGGNPHRSEVVREGTNYKLNCRDLYLKDFVGGIGIILLKFRLLRSPDIFWNHASWSQKAWKRGNLEVYIVVIYICAWLSSCGRFGIASVLQQFRATSTCCVLSFNFIGGTSVLEFLQPFFLVTCDPRSLRAKDLVRRWTCGFYQIFASSASSKTKMSKNFSSWHTENLIRTKANLRWNNQIKNSSRAQMKYHTAIRVTCDTGWRWILIRGINAL